MEKITVVASEPSGVEGKYDTLLSNGETVVTNGAYPVGAEFVNEPAPAQDRAVRLDFAYDPETKQVSVLIDHVERYRGPLPALTKALDDNAMLARGLDDANAAIASQQMTIDEMRVEIEQWRATGGQLKAPASLTNVMTRDVADLPPLASLQPAPTMPEEPGKGPLSDEEAVERHLAVKAATKVIVQEIEDATASEGTKA